MRTNLQALVVSCAIGLPILVESSAVEAQTLSPQGQISSQQVEQEKKSKSSQQWWELSPLVDASSPTPNVVERLTKDAEAGDINAQFRLAKMYLSTPKSLPAIHEKGIFWLNLAAEKGHPEAVRLRLARAAEVAKSKEVKADANTFTWDSLSANPPDKKPNPTPDLLDKKISNPASPKLITDVDQGYESMDKAAAYSVGLGFPGSVGSILVGGLLFGAGLYTLFLVRERQKKILLTFCVVVVGMLLFPPFHILRVGTEINMGYGFLFSPPRMGNLTASVSVAVLTAQWVGTILVAAVGWVLTRNNAKPDKEDSAQATVVGRKRNPESKTLIETASLLLLRLFRVVVGLVFGWQIIGLFPVATWVVNPAAITVNMVAVIVLKIVIAAVFGMTFFGIRKYTNWLHKHWFGIPHPALSKAMSL